MKERRKKGIFAALICILLVLAVVVNSKMNRDRSREMLLSVRGKLEIGMSRAEAYVTIRQFWPEKDFSPERGEVRTPLELGASNWSLLLDFDNEKLAAIAIRSDDSLLRLPLGAPDDIVQPGFRPWWDESRFE